MQRVNGLRCKAEVTCPGRVSKTGNGPGAARAGSCTSLLAGRPPSPAAPPELGEEQGTGKGCPPAGAGVN